MTLILFILSLVLLVAAIPFVIRSAQSAGRSLAWNARVHPDGKISFVAEEAFALRHLLCKRGTAASDVGICDAGDLPIAVMDDEADADDVDTGLPKNCLMLGAVSGTVRMIAAEAIPDDTDVYATGAGKVGILATAASGDYLVGRSVSAADVDGDEIAVIPVLPVTQKA